jgi:hypothetical protein
LAGTPGREARDNARNRLVVVCAFQVGCLQSRVKQSAKAGDMLTRVECRGSRQPGLLCFLGIKLSETGPNLLAGGMASVASWIASSRSLA